MQLSRKLQSKTLAKDFFYRTVPPALSRHLLPLMPGQSPFVDGIVTREVIFVHIPKAAGTTLKATLYGDMPSGGHRRIAEYFAYDPDRAQAFFKFGFVRNPWSRLLSAHSHLTQQKATNRRDRQFASEILSRFDTFNDFVIGLEEARYRRAVMCYDHFQPQTYWICRPGESRHALDFLGRFETLANDVTALSERLSLDLDASRQVRRSNHPDYRDAYTERARHVVAELYARDIATFGYAF